MDLINLFDFEAAAREKLSAMAYDYYRSGSFDEITLEENHAAYDRLRLRFRVLRDVSERDLSIELLGRRISMPMLIAPTAFHRLAHPDGEAATARAAAAAGTIMTLSTLSNCSIEEVAAAAAGPLWFQLYVYRDREATRELVGRAEAAGYSALVLTVDAQVWATRERDVRNRFHLPAGMRMANLMTSGLDSIEAHDSDSGLGRYVASLFDPTLAWSDLEWLAGISQLPLVIKGIVDPEDARRAVDHGAAAVIVSNHGGRQLDTSIATIDALPAVAEAVDGRIPVLVDGGVRRGTDVVKALALGARAVLVGRPVLWGLAVNGEEGVAQVLDILRKEFDVALGLCGCRSCAELDRDLLAGV
ncbi:MAG: alpha-hydroxy-acid oxidizing protein [Gemmatimonadota bacterium]|nr:MAG: alpha-hydroxy-acid oxidizing protein [Gemmatimonadota bacterium]